MRKMKTKVWRRSGSHAIEFTELGFGTGPLGGLFKAVSESEADEILAEAWDSGVRYFDTAPLYGLTLSEIRLGRFLSEKPRGDYVVSTKAGRIMLPCDPKDRTGFGKWFGVPDKREHYDYSYDGILRSFEESLERLDLHSVDILYVHDLCSFTHGSGAASDAKVDEFMNGGYFAMLRLREEGSTRAIGGGINEWDVCQALAERGDFDIFIPAGRYTLLEQEPLETFFPLCIERGIGIVMGGPYNSGVLASGAVPGARFEYAPAPEAVLDRVARIQEICLAYGVELKDAALRFPLFHSAVVSVIPGGQSVDEVRSNREALDAEIPNAFWRELKSEGLVRADAPVPV